jgi:PAS domain S-box-containing protein
MDAPGQECLAAIAEFSTDPVMLVSANGLIEWASPSTRDALGFSPDVLIGTRARDLVLAEDHDSWRVLVDRILEQPGVPIAGSFRCRHHDGSVRRTYGVARNLLNDSRVKAILVAFRDATPAREIEAALKTSEDRYRQLFEEATDIVFEADEEGYFRFVNPAARRIFGYDAGEILGRRFTEFIRPDHRRRVFEHYRAQADSRQTSSYIEFPAIAKNGDEVWVGQNAWMVTDAQGRFRGMRAVARDVTQRLRVVDTLREAEARYRSLVEQSHFAVYIMQSERMVYVNPKGAELVGYSCDELLAMPSVFEVIAPADHTYVREQFERLGEGAVPVPFVARAVRKDGSTVTGEVSCSVAEYGGRPALIASVVDLTDRLELEEQLRHAQKMEAVGRLAGGVAHDFNNLLTAIRGNAELLQHRFHGQTAGAAEIEEIVQAADRAAATTRQLLAFSRKQDVAATTVDVNAIVENVARLVRRLIGPHVHLEIRAARGLAPVVADPAQLEQVLLNLVLNARDALPEGGRIRVRTANVRIAERSPAAARTGLPTGRYVLLQVRDNGIGMDPATQARVFEPFFTTKEPGRGTGLGLSTVYGNVRQMGGIASVDSVLNRGSVFSVHLPAAAIESVSSTPSSSEQEV